LTPGEYLITASYKGLKTQTRRVKVTNAKMAEATRLDFWLEPEGTAPVGEPMARQLPMVCLYHYFISELFKIVVGEV